MTDRHDEWAPEDDEAVRRALMSLMGDVADQPLPEPAQIRARAEGRADGQVTDLDLHRRRRRSLAFLAGVAAAALVATGAGLLVLNQHPDTPIATSTTDRSTASTVSTGTSAPPSRLRALGPAEWEAVLGVPVEDTVTGEPDEHCFRPAEGSTWQSRSARLADTSRVAGQWIGTSPEGTAPLVRSVDRSITGCEGYSRSSSIDDELADGGSFRAWHNTGAEGPDVWWVEVDDGTSASFLAVPETDGRAYTDQDIRTLARGVLGEVDLARPSTTSSATSTRGTGGTGGTDPGETTTATSTTTEEPTSSAPGGSPTPGEPSTPGGPSDPGGSSTSEDGTTDPSSPTDSPTPPDPTVPAAVPASAYVRPGSWSSQTLTGGQPTVSSPLALGGATTIDPCASTDGAARAGGLGVRSGEDDTFFGRQYVLMTDTGHEADQLMSDLVGRYASDCGGAAETRPLSDSSRVDTFALAQGGRTTYVAVVRQSSTSVTILQLTSPRNAPAPLTDATADQELTRLAGLARR